MLMGGIIMNEQIKVSVICLAFNHANNIRKCLEGFVNQKTNFDYEVLVHDDASTDGTTEIIKEYEKNYPHIIKPIYQKENQYSQGVKITKKYILPKMKGEYVAWCEGDDYWSDSNKLQKQIDFLDQNSDYAICAHKVLFNNLKTKTEHIVPKIDIDRDFTVDEIIKKGAIVQLSSIIMRTALYLNKPDCFYAKGFGDIQLYIYGAICGKFRVINEVMSVYNHGTEGSWTKRIADIPEKNIIHSLEQIRMYNEVNRYYAFKYNESFTYAISRSYFNIAVSKKDKKEMRKLEYREFYNQYKRAQRVKFLQKKLPGLYGLLKKIKG